MKRFLIILTLLLTSLILLRALLNSKRPPGQPAVLSPTPLPTIIQEEGSQIKLIKNISAKEDLLGMAYSPDEKRLFITSFDEKKIYVIDTDRDEILKELDTSIGPYGISFLAAQNELVVSGGSKQVVFLDPGTGQEKGLLEVGLKPLDIIKSPDEKYLFTANTMDDTVSVVDPKSKQVIKLIGVGRSPERLFLSADGEWLFVNNRSSDDISVISTQSLTLSSTITIFGNPTALAHSKQASALYLLDSWTNELVTLSDQNYQVTARMPVDELPIDAVLSPSKKRLYVLSFAKNSLLVVNLKERIIENRLNFSPSFLPETGLNRLLLLPKSQKLYITNTNFGKVIVLSIK